MNASRTAQPTGDDGPVLEIRSLSKEFGYRRVLEDIHLVLYEGQLILLLGRNGSGKTTLIRMVSGLMRPSSGMIRFEGAELGENPARYRRAVGLISHRSGLYGELTARENLHFFARLAGVDRITEAVPGALEETELAPFADIPVKTFSSGMTKRLAIARLMVLKPRILLLDEPYTGLDDDSTAVFNRYLAVFKAGGGSVLMISHQIETCFNLCDEIVVLEQRRLQQRFEADRLTCGELIKTYHQLTGQRVSANGPET